MLPPTPKTDQTTRGFAAQLPRNLAANIAYFLVSNIIGVLQDRYSISIIGSHQRDHFIRESNHWLHGEIIPKCL